MQASITAAIAVVLAGGAFANIIYDVTDLGTLGGTYSAAYGINDHGVIVGQSEWTNGESHAFIWSNGVMSRLLTAPYITSSVAFDINSTGHAVGSANTTGGMIQAFLLAGATYTNLGVFTGGDFSVARSINDHDGISGQSHVYVNPVQLVQPHAFLWTNGVMIEIPPFDGAYSTEGYGVNDAGQVAGFSYRFCPSDCYHPFIWWDMNSNSVAEVGEMTDAGTLGGSVGQAYGINHDGLAVGASTLAGFTNYHAFLITPQNGQWDDDDNYGSISNSFMKDLGTLGGTNSYAYAINDAGVVVGASELANGTNHAFVYDAGVMMDLNDLVDTNTGWLLQSAEAINSSGHIAGYGTVTGQTHAFLLTPTSNEVHLTGIAVNFDSATNELSLHWNGRGSNLGFTVETTQNTTSGIWQAVQPTSQWPVLSPFWSDASTLVPTGSAFRVRAESY